MNGGQWRSSEGLISRITLPDCDENSLIDFFSPLILQELFHRSCVIREHNNIKDIRSRSLKDIFVSIRVRENRCGIGQWGRGMMGMNNCTAVGVSGRQRAKLLIFIQWIWVECHGGEVCRIKGIPRPRKAMEKKFVQ